jgi:uncharacterized protein
VSSITAQHLAALRWLLLSPPLVVSPDAASQLAGFTPQERASIGQWLQALEADSTTLVDWMHTRAEARIGRYAERLLEFYLTHGPQHRLVAAHVPLHSEVNGLKVTHGELDFLLTNAQGQHLHWELAVKFFLCMATGESATPADFIGPNGVETLAHKWHKLFAKQLAHKPPEPWNAHIWQSQAFTRGWMFYRWGSVVPQCAALHVDHCKAWWIDWADMGQLPQGQYVHLPRLQWMAPVKSVVQLGADAVLYSRSEIALHLRQLWGTTERGTDAQMIVLLSSSFAEMHRFFIRPAFNSP